MLIYSLMLAKLALGLLCLILQINLLGKGNLAPNSAALSAASSTTTLSRFWTFCSFSLRGRCSC